MESLNNDDIGPTSFDESDNDESNDYSPERQEFVLIIIIIIIIIIVIIIIIKNK